MAFIPASTVPQHYVQQFSSNVQHLSQQMYSRVWELFPSQSLTGEGQYYDRIGQTEARKRTGRHEDTPLIEVTHDRRRADIDDWVWATLCSQEDKLRMIYDPKSRYAEAAAAALARRKDRIALEQLTGVAREGKNGETNVSLPTSQKIAAKDGNAFGPLSVATLRAAKKKLKQSEAAKKGQMLYWITDANGTDDLLATTEVTSADYNTIKALVAGEVDTFMGFKFIETELIHKYTSGTIQSVGVTGGARNIACTPDALQRVIATDVETNVDLRPDKNREWQIYSNMTLGAVRTEEVKVIEVAVKAS